MNEEWYFADETGNISIVKHLNYDPVSGVGFLVVYDKNQNDGVKGTVYKDPDSGEWVSSCGPVSLRDSLSGCAGDVRAPNNVNNDGLGLESSPAGGGSGETDSLGDISLFWRVTGTAPTLQVGDAVILRGATSDNLVALNPAYSATNTATGLRLTASVPVTLDSGSSLATMRSAGGWPSGDASFATDIKGALTAARELLAGTPIDQFHVLAADMSDAPWYAARAGAIDFASLVSVPQGPVPPGVRLLGEVASGVAKFHLEVDQPVVITRFEVVDVSGRRLWVRAGQELRPGSQVIAAKLRAPGIYFGRLLIEGYGALVARAVVLQ